jgi:ubiquinone/menaquinone biosynthesis C-methylase UbiE
MIDVTVTLLSISTISPAIHYPPWDRIMTRGRGFNRRIICPVLDISDRKAHNGGTEAAIFKLHHFFFLGRISVKKTAGVGLRDVQAVYSGPEGDLWELVMGQQVHIGGFASSMDLAEKAGIGAGMSGVDLCCCNGAGMRFLVRFRSVAKMHGVDATENVVARGRDRCKAEGYDGRIGFTIGDACHTGLPDASADFVWGEDAWCYVVDKKQLVAEAVRLIKPGGTIAFTDWIEGTAGLTDREAERFLKFMKFPNILDLKAYTSLLAEQGCEILTAADTGRFAPYVDLYLNMLNMQLTYDALKIIGFDMPLMEAMGGEMNFMRDLAHAGKIAQGQFIARKKT